MFVVKRDGRKEDVKFDKITSRINKLCYGLDSRFVDSIKISQKVGWVGSRRIHERCGATSVTPHNAPVMMVFVTLMHAEPCSQPREVASRRNAERSLWKPRVARC